MGPRTYDEKRDFRRMEMVDCPVTFRNLATGESGTGSVRNLSGSGLLITSVQALPVGARFQINVTPARSLVPPLDAQAEVVRVTAGTNGYDIALTITSFGP